MKYQILLVCLAAVFMQASARVTRDAPAATSTLDLESLLENARNTWKNVTASWDPESLTKFFENSELKNKVESLKAEMEKNVNPEVKKKFEEVHETANKIVEGLKTSTAETTKKAGEDLNALLQQADKALKELSPEMVESGKEISAKIASLVESVKKQITDITEKTSG